MATRFHTAIESLEHHPKRGRPVSRGLYELLVVKPYLIRYRIGADSVEVIRIRHAAQRPG